jgi:seryl-tRNA synthetase
MLWIPNLPHESVPVADGEEGNVPHPPVGLMQEFDFAPKAHWELGAQLGIIDIERGVKLSGSRFYILRGLGARLQRALIAFFLDHAREAGFIEAYVPYLVTEPMLYGASQFPKFRDVVYSDPDAGLFLLPTAEVALTNMYRDEVIDEDALPLYFVAQSPCFRHEKAAAGKDTRGIKRVHQFEKVEMYKFTTPETSYDELESLTRTAESLCDQLGLYHRRLEIATGDLGFSATKKYDVEVWAPGSEEWLEVSSCSNTEAFQARRAMIRYRPRGAKNTRYVHTLNGSGLGLPRTIIAILETYQQADGSVRVPPVLVPYLGGAEVIEPV